MKITQREENRMVNTEEEKELSVVKTKNLLRNATIFEILFLSFLNPLLKIGQERPLQIDDIPLTHDSHSPIMIKKAIQAKEKELNSKYKKNSPTKIKKLKFTTILFHSFKKKLYFAMISHIIWASFFLLTPYFLRDVLKYVRSHDNDNNSSDNKDEKETYIFGITNGYILVLSMIFCGMLSSNFLNLQFYWITRFGCYLRDAIMSSIFEKSLRLSNKSRNEFSTGSIVTLMSLGSERVYLGIQMCNFLVMSPLIIMCVLIMIVIAAGMTSIIGVIVMASAITLQITIATKTGNFRKKLVICTEERVKLINEALKGIRVIKMYNWEEPIQDIIKKVRKQELDYLKKYLLCRIFGYIVVFIAPTVSMGVMVITYTSMTGKTMPVELYYAVLALLGITRLPSTAFPQAAATMSEAIVAFRRIDKFMALDEIDEIQNDDKEYKDTDNLAVSISNGSFSWMGDTKVDHVCDPSNVTITMDKDITIDKSTTSLIRSGTNITLDNINLNIKKGELVAIVGKVGSGKSSIAMAILGELSKISGESKISGNFAYVSQTPWILNQTIRDNIIFNRDYDRDRYEYVLKVSSLERDLLILPDGDQTEIGENGINLSGGQKARIEIARALYSDMTDIFIFDDPLSALDAHVGKSVFEEGIVHFLKNKTRIITLSSNYHLLPAADKIIYIADGRITMSGSYSHLSTNYPGLFVIEEEKGKADKKKVDRPNLRRNFSAPMGLNDETKNNVEDPPKMLQRTQTSLMRQEDRDIGAVTWKSYIEYFKGGNKSTIQACLTISLILMSFVISQGFRISSDAYLGYACEQQLSLSTWIYRFWGLASGLLLFVMIRTVLYFRSVLQSSEGLHAMVLKAVLKAPVNLYFDITPLGQILNRFAQDLDNMDSILTFWLYSFTQNFIFIISAFVVCLITIPWFILIILPVLFIIRSVMNSFRSSSREMKRLDGISRSPIFSSFSEMLNGISTIRAFKKSDEFIEKHDKAVAINSAAFFIYHLASRWVGLRLDYCSVCFGGLLSLLSVFLVDQGYKVDVNLLGLALVYSIQLTGMIQITVRSAIDVENAMTSTERLLQQSNIPQEKSSIVKDYRPPTDWPSRGEIEIENLKLRYRPELDIALQGVSLHVKPGKMVGICGRTGAGKSSLTQAFFRMVEPENGSKIKIDGIDILRLGLDDLRSNITIVPQDPILFSSTLRFNLDPFDKYSDHELYDVLEKVFLKDLVKSFDGGLDFRVTEGGGNFSVGQKQLICIGRALLRKPRVLLLDEATASIDTETDNQIQTSIRKNFKGSTVLCIAHRLETIIDYDVIAVLDDGKLSEMDTPSNLMDNEKSLFSSMVQNLGDSTIQKLFEIIAKKEEADKNAKL